MKYKLVAFWLVVFGALFAFLQTRFEYHFYYIEQSQLFLFSEAYIRNKLVLPGGFSMLVAEFFVQFFIRPYVGALVTAALLTGVGICTAGIVKRIASASGLFILYVQPMLALLFMHFDFNYRVQGTVCYLMMTALLCGYIRIRNDLFRLVAGCVLVPVLFWLAGSIAVLFAGMICLFEGLRKTPKWYISLIGVAEVLLLGVGTVYFSLMGEYRWVFGPDLYYHYTLHPKEIIYYSWICLPLVFLVAFFVRNKNSLSGKKLFAGISCIAQLAMIAAVLWWGMPKYSDAKTLKLKKLDYFARTEQWDKTIEECKGKLTNFLYMCHLNMALANKGELSDKMFNFDQVWNRVTVNRAEKKATRYYMDEFHLLLKEEQTAAYSVEIWKRFRKWGGIPTAITQNVKDLLSSREVENIFENSDFVLMLNQAQGDRAILAKQLNISPQQMKYVTHTEAGEGLIFYGNVVLPFIDRFPTDTELYCLLTTKPEEVSKP